MYNECDIVKDLIPLYGENLASFGSQDLIEEHCKECEDCKKELELALKLLKTKDEENKESRQDKVWARIELKRKKTKRSLKIILGVTASLIAIILFLFYSFILCGNTWFTKVDLNVADSYENSDVLYTKSYVNHPAKDEVEAAANEVKSYFSSLNSQFGGNVLLELSYDEKNTYNESYSESHTGIVFVSKFYVLISDGSMEQGECMENWRWTVHYNNYYGKWEVVSYGYG